MSQTKEERLATVYERARRRFNDSWSAVYEVREQCAADRRFTSVTGGQWEGSLGEQFANKPRFELNKVHLAVIRIINEYRNNRIDVDFTSKDGTKEDKLADTCDGLYRADERDSGAQEALDNAFEEAVTGGFGAYRLRASDEDEEDEDSDRRRIRFEPIYDADTTVFFDANAKRQDKRDAEFGFLMTSFTRSAFEDAYPDENTSGWPVMLSDGASFDWCTPDVVWVAEYYEVEHKKRKLHFFSSTLLPDSPEQKITADDLTDDKLAELAATGWAEVRQKTVKVRKIHKYCMNGGRVMEDEGIIAGKYIPIVPVFGKRWFVDGIERCMGHPRLAVDAQRLKNMLVSLLAEISTLASVEKPIFTPEQIVGHTEMWANDNVQKYPYLLVNSLTDALGNVTAAGPIAYTRAPTIPQALAALLQISEQDLQDLLGNAQAGEEIQPNISGKVVELIQNRLDMQTFIYMSNFSKGVQMGGEIWLSMARDLYVEEGRKMKSLSPDGQTGSIELMKPAVDPDTNELITLNDMTAASFDVNVDVGPSSTSRRSSTVRQLTAVLQVTQDPETRSVLEAMILMNMEGEGMDDTRAYFRSKLVKQGVVKPTDEEKLQLEQAAANAPPDPNAAFLEASAKKALADAAQSEAKVGNVHADTIAKLAGIESKQLNDAIALAGAISPDASGAQALAGQEQPALPQGAQQ